MRLTPGWSYSYTWLSYKGYFWSYSYTWLSYKGYFC